MWPFIGSLLTSIIGQQKKYNQNCTRKSGKVTRVVSEQPIKAEIPNYIFAPAPRSWAHLTRHRAAHPRGPQAAALQGEQAPW